MESLGTSNNPLLKKAQSIVTKADSRTKDFIGSEGVNTEKKLKVATVDSKGVPKPKVEIVDLNEKKIFAVPKPNKKAEIPKTGKKTDEKKASTKAKTESAMNIEAALKMKFKKDPLIRDSSPLIYSIHTWADQNFEKIKAAHALKGGWEPWAQVELAIALSRAHGWKHGDAADADPEFTGITREDYVYDTPGLDPDKQVYNTAKDFKADIMLATSTHEQKWWNILELKCQSSFNAAKYIRNVIADIAKVDTNGINPELKPALVWVVGISVTKNAQELETAFKATGQNVVVYRPRRESEVDGVRIVYWKKDFPK